MPTARFGERYKLPSEVWGKVLAEIEILVSL